MIGRAAAVLLLLASGVLPAAAQSGPFGAMEGPGGGSAVSLRAGGVFNAGGGLGMFDLRQEARVALSTSPSGAWSVHQRVGRLKLSKAVALPGGPVVDDELWSVEAGAGYRRSLESGGSFGASLTLGSDSDKPFHSGRERLVRGLLDLRVPSGERGAWMYFLFYANNSSFLSGLPIPGVAYQFRSQDGRLGGLVGLPFAMVSARWGESWSGRVALFGLRRVSLEAGRRMGPLRASAGFDMGGLTWLRAGRPDRDDLLNYERKRLTLGLEAAGAVLSAGREFDRSFFETDRDSKPETGAAELPAAYFAEFTYAWRFGGPPPPGPRR